MLSISLLFLSSIRVMAPYLPQELWDNVTQHLSSPKVLQLASVFHFKLLPEQRKHAQVWGMLFQSEKWLDAAERHGLNPVLVGYDLEYCYNRKTLDQQDRYLILQPGDMSGDFTTYSKAMPRLFMSCLRSHEFDEKSKVIKIDRLSVYIGAVFNDPETMVLPKLSKLFSHKDRSPESRYLFWRHTKNTQGQLGRSDMRGYRGKPKRLRQVTSLCCLILSQSCVRSEHPSEYYFMQEGFVDSIVVLGQRGLKDGWDVQRRYLAAT